MDVSKLNELDVLYHRLGHLGELGWLSLEEKSFPKLWLDVDTCVREQVRSKRVPSSLCLGTACLAAMRREGCGGHPGSGEPGSQLLGFSRGQIIHICLSQKEGPEWSLFSGTQASHRESTFLFRLSFCCPFNLIIFLLGWPLGLAVLPMEGKTAFSFLFLSCHLYTWAWNRAESTSSQKPWAMESKSQLPHGLNIHVKKQNH